VETPRDLDLLINGERRGVRVDPTASLLEVLRGPLGLTGARYGCGAGECGACVVLVDGAARPACQIEAGNLPGRAIITLEGLGTPERPHPLQAAFIELQAGQCGYCLAGIVMAAKALIDADPHPSRETIARALSGHLCRCGAHNRILAAVALAARRMREAGEAPS
jgi:nicotinate dehydrogenase subunit A